MEEVFNPALPWQDFNTEVKKAVHQKKVKIRNSLLLGTAVCMALVGTLAYLFYVIAQQKEQIVKQENELKALIGMEEQKREIQVKNAKTSIDAAREDAAKSVANLATEVGLFKEIEKRFKKDLNEHKGDVAQRLNQKQDKGPVQQQISQLQNDINTRTLNSDFQQTKTSLQQVIDQKADRQLLTSAIESQNQLIQSKLDINALNRELNTKLSSYVEVGNLDELKNSLMREIRNKASKDTLRYFASTNKINQLQLAIQNLDSLYIHKPKNIRP